MAISAVDTISVAFQHAKRQLLQPFRFGQWTRLAVVGLLAGELGSGGGCNGSHNFPRQPGAGGGGSFPGLHGIDPVLLALLIAVVVVAALVFVIVMMYVSSVMQFILFDSVLAKECHIRQGWRRRQGPAVKLFWWKLLFSAVWLVVFVILIGIPAGFAFVMGWFQSPKEHLLPLILGGIFVFFAFVLVMVTAALIHVMTKDFVVPQMALEGVGAIEGWRRLLAMMAAEKGGYASYILVKIGLAIVAGIVIGLATVILAMVFAVPAIILAVLAGVTGSAAGLTWNVYTITVAVVVGIVLFAVLFYLIALISVPAIVFFPAYSIYFFAARYRALGMVLYPPSPASGPGLAPPPPPEPPPLPPVPDAIG